MSFLRREISSAIKLSMVLIHVELMPNFDPMSRKQKNLANNFPKYDDLHVCVVQEWADVLSTAFSKIGKGSSIGFSTIITVKAAQ